MPFPGALLSRDSVLLKESTFISNMKISGVVSTFVLASRAGNCTIDFDGNTEIDVRLLSYLIGLVKYFDWY